MVNEQNYEQMANEYRWFIMIYRITNYKLNAETHGQKKVYRAISVLHVYKDVGVL